MLIRPESPTDQEAVFHVNARAFGRDTEARLVDALRHSPAFIPELSLVACIDSGDGVTSRETVAGHILFTRMGINDRGRMHEALALAPLAVEPGHQKQGIGSALVARGLSEAGRLGHRIVIVLGHPDYYPKFGFVPAETFGIRAPFDVRPEAFMALELQAGALRDVRGDAVYAAEFSEV